MAVNRDGVVISAYTAVIQQLAEARPTIESIGIDIFPDGGPTPMSLVEISGRPNSGKTAVLSEIMARCLPPTYFSGRYCDVIFLNLDHKLSIPNFVKNIKRIIVDSGEPSTLHEVDSVVESCLDSIQIINCFSSEEFDLAIESLEDILLANRNVALVAIDNIEAFYWNDVHKKLVRMSTHYNRHVRKLKNICEAHKISCVYTVDSNCLETKSSSVKSGFSVVPNYRFQIQTLPDKSRILNLLRHGFKSLNINESGLQLGDSWK